VDGRPVLAVGDAWILNDPLAAQGANLGSRSAFALGAAILQGGPYDEDFARRAEARMWEQAQAPCALSNALLEPPPAHVLELLVRAGHDQQLADRFADGFGHPEHMLQLLAPVNAAA
jgi:2-polyprenyl-6-methoxyphenol hydroxylase-like FAD-dependent oxidoreductase